MSATQPTNSRLASHAESFAPLLIAEKEASDRMERAEATVAEAHRRLKADLEAGRDTSTARRVLHEAERLSDEAAQALLNASEALRHATERAITERADALATGVNAVLAASLSRFNLKENVRGN